jgi:hypothetical protein
MTPDYWTAAQTYADPLGVSERKSTFDAEIRRKQNQRNAAERVHRESQRTDGVVETGETVSLADLLGIDRHSDDDLPTTLDGRDVQALYGIVPEAPRQPSPEEKLARSARDARASKAAKAIHDVRDKLAEIARRKEGR